MKRLLLCLVAALGASACGHYYHGYYPGAVALGAPTVVVGDEDSSIVAGTLVTGTASGEWTAQNGWSGASGGVAAPVDASVAAGVSITADASCAVPRVASQVATGNGVGLSGLVGPGIHVTCNACSVEGGAGAGATSSSSSSTASSTTGGGSTSGGADVIAALSLLGSLSSLSLGGDATVLTSDAVRLEASLAHDALPHAGGDSAIVVRALGGPPGPTPTPVRVHLVIDASASMESRWDEVLEAAIALVGRLRPADELQIVVYSTGARVVFPPTRVNDGEAARAVIRGLTCSGQTNIEAGLRAAYGALDPNGGSVVLLLSDGVPEGGYATPGELGSLAADARTRTGATTVTIGLGNEFHPGILRAIARRGGGDFRIAPSSHELAAVLEAELAAHTNVVARDVAFDLQLAPGVRIAASLDLASLDAAVTLDGAHVTIRLGTLAASETRTVVLPIVISSPPGAVAQISASATAASGPLTGQHALALREAARAIPAGGLAASLDADLASALASAATAVENGDASTASATIRAHAETARRVASGDPAILARVDHALAFAAGLESSVPSASWGARRQAASAMLEWSVGLGR
ncbi:MAG: VWA domain-containing protein [Sandaracinus sp.]